MPKIRVEIEVGNEFCGKCPMFQLYPRLRDTHCNRGAFCGLYDIPLTFSSRNLAYMRCDECKQAEVKDGNK